MVRTISIAVAFAVLCFPAIAQITVDTATVTCDEYNKSGHILMVAMEAAFHELMKGDPDLGSLSQSALSDVMWEKCKGQTDMKVIDAIKPK